MIKTFDLSKIHVLLFGILVTVLAGCGGSGGGSDDDPVADDDNTSSTNGNWESLGTVGNISTLDTMPMVIDSNGNPLVAWVNSDNQVRVDRWNSVDETWEKIGDTFDGMKPALALDSNDQPLLVYWKAPEGTYFTAYAVQWNGTSWEQLGSGDNAIVDRSTAFEDSRVFADVQFDSQGAPVIALPDVAAGKHNQITVMRWDSSDWQAVGTSPQVNIGEGVHTAALVSDANDRLVLAWSELPQDINGYTYEESKAYVAEWGGSSWAQLGSTRATEEQVRELDMALESDGTPVIAWRSTAVSGINGPTYLRRWSGTDWLAHGDTLSDAWNPSLAIDSSDRPMIASDDLATDRKVSLRRWDSSTWRMVETALPGEKAVLALSNTGTIYVSVQAYPGSELSVYRLP